MFKGEKVYTHRLAGSLELNGAGIVQSLAIDTFFAEEDTEVIGMQMFALELGQVSNDGYVHGGGWLSQSAASGVLEGRLGHVFAETEWNTTPAFGTRTAGITTVMLPQGKSIHIKEEGALYLNMNQESTAVGIHTVFVEAVVFYHKRGTGR